MPSPVERSRPCVSRDPFPQCGTQPGRAPHCRRQLDGDQALGRRHRPRSNESTRTSEVARRVGTGGERPGACVQSGRAYAGFRERPGRHAMGRQHGPTNPHAERLFGSGQGRGLQSRRGSPGRRGRGWHAETLGPEHRPGRLGPIRAEARVHGPGVPARRSGVRDLRFERHDRAPGTDCGEAHPLSRPAHDLGERPRVHTRRSAHRRRLLRWQRPVVGHHDGAGGAGAARGGRRDHRRPGIQPRWAKTRHHPGRREFHQGLGHDDPHSGNASASRRRGVSSSSSPPRSCRPRKSLPASAAIRPSATRSAPRPGTRGASPMNELPDHAGRDPDGLDLDLVRRIDAACRRFEADWRVGERPVIDDDFANVPDEGRLGLGDAEGHRARDMPPKHRTHAAGHRGLNAVSCQDRSVRTSGLAPRYRCHRKQTSPRSRSMPWSASQYTKFEDERTRPVRDLVAAIPTAEASRAIDLGCGPGNSTEVLMARYPAASITGIDSAEDMVRAARERLPSVAFELADIATWHDSGPWDVIVANAVLHWVPEHAVLLPRLVDVLSSGGSLAVQMPDNLAEPSHVVMQEVANDGPWAAKLAGAHGERSTGRAGRLVLQPAAAPVRGWTCGARPIIIRSPVSMRSSNGSRVPASVPSFRLSISRNRQNTSCVIERRWQRPIPSSRTGRCYSHFPACSSWPRAEPRRVTGDAPPPARLAANSRPGPRRRPDAAASTRSPAPAARARRRS